MLSVTESNTAKCGTRAEWVPPGVGRRGSQRLVLGSLADGNLGAYSPQTPVNGWAPGPR